MDTDTNPQGSIYLAPRQKKKMERVHLVTDRHVNSPTQVVNSLSPMVNPSTYRSLRRHPD